jgi:16S rRNA C1402 (ribose-2'-O) methylase RsmI
MSNVFRHSIAFGSMPIGNPADISINMIEHINRADVLVIENHRQFAMIVETVNRLKLMTHADISPSAIIYQYQLENGQHHIDYINQRVVQEAETGKKILIISDEGASIFLEPMSQLKEHFDNRGLDYYFIPGPNSVISAVVSGTENVHQFYFGGNYQWVNDEDKQIAFKMINDFKKPVVFILTAQGTPEYVQEILQNINIECLFDFGINLSMEDEFHLEVNDKNIVKDFIQSNPDMWEKDDDKKKCIITIHPRKMEKQ